MHIQKNTTHVEQVSTPTIQPGQVYEHYKGKKYKIITLALHTDDLSPVVVYECLYENELSKIWVRPLAQFFETITHEGCMLPRFKLVED